MPLLKLWNSIRGRSAPAEKRTNRSQESATDAAGQASSARKSSATADSPKSKSDSPKSKSRGRGSSGRWSKGPRLSLFGGGGPHATLRKLVKSLRADTVLEIAVGDGSRAIAILQALGNQPQARYVAIDQFEMVGNEITLKAFHQALRSEGIRPQVFPESIERGLIRVANTVGAVNLVVIAAEPSDWQSPETLYLLARVCHGETVVLFQDDDSWERYEGANAGSIRRAA